MGLMDKVKAQAEVGLAKASEAGKAGQAKLDAAQAKRKADGLLHDLGAVRLRRSDGSGKGRDGKGRRPDRPATEGLRSRVRPARSVSRSASGGKPRGTTGDAGSGAEGRRSIAVVPHTHWDREWYEPFQTFRLKLVSLIDGLLDQLERDSSYRHFLLDGQVAVVDDYLEIRPENEQRLRALAAAGRLSVGPWYILMDEFLVSGETLVRNLQAGIARGASFGGVMDVGYLPDMFGHIAQMPQLLASAGFADAVVWRGVPSAVDRTAFEWEAPDGSVVRAEYLVAGYGNGAALPDDAKALVRRLRAQVEEFGPFLGDGRPDAPDERDRPPATPAGARALARRGQPDPGRLRTRHHHAARVPRGGTERRAAALARRAPLGLPHQPADGRRLQPGGREAGRGQGGADRSSVWPSRCRRSTCRRRAGPSAFLDLAWKLVVRNSAHDSVCACSVDEVVDVGAPPLRRGTPDRRGTHGRPPSQGSPPPCRHPGR